MISSYRWILLLSVFAVAALLSCQTKPVFPLEPSIEFVEITPKVIRQNVDTFYITFSFKDGDGDIGRTGKEGVNAIYMVDERMGLYPTDPPQVYVEAAPINVDLKPNTKNPSIQGKLTVMHSPTIVRKPFAQKDKTVFTVYIYDRAGNKSNEIKTDTLTILP